MKCVDQGEAAASFSRVIAERAIMPFVLKATASLLGNTDCIEACSTICRALEKLEKATSSEFMEEVQALWRMCRGIAVLLSPEPGICGCTSDDVLFATTPPSDLDMEAPLDLLRPNVSEDAYFQEKSSEYSSTLLSEKSSAATLAKHIEALTSKNDQLAALRGALDACPSLMTNLRAGATARLEKLILSAVDDLVQEILSDGLGEKELRSFGVSLT